MAQDVVKLSDFVLEELRSAIVNGELAKGTLHSIYELADRFQVSRTPVREAVLRLADTGMVTIERNRGIRVEGLSTIEIHRVFEMRLLLEVPAASHAASIVSPELVAELESYLESMREAIGRRDPVAFFVNDYALHDRVLGSLENPRLNKYVGVLRDITDNMGVSTTQHSRTLREVGLEHEPIVEQIREGNAEAAATSMAHHLVRTGTLMIAQMTPDDPGALSEEWAANALSLLRLPSLPLSESQRL